MRTIAENLFLTFLPFLTLLFFPPEMHAQVSMQKNGFVGRLDFSSKGVENLLTFALKNGLPKLEFLLTNYRVPDQILRPIRPDPYKCRKDQVAQMWAKQAWEECWGVPEFALSTWTQLLTGSFLRSHRPRPSVIQLSNVIIRSIDVGNYSLRCSKATCEVEIELRNLIARSDIIVSDLNSDNEFFRAQGLDLHLRSGKNGVFPNILLVFTLNSHLPLNEMIQFDLEETKLNIPNGSFAIGFADDPEPISYDYGGLFTSGNKDKYDHQHDLFASKSNFEWFLASANILNTHLTRHHLFMHAVEKLVLKVIKKEALPRLKQMLADQLYPRTINLPDVSIQRLVDGPTQTAIYQKTYEQILDYRSITDAASSYDLKHNKKIFNKMIQQVSSMVQSYTAGIEEKQSEYLRHIHKELKTTCRSSLSFANHARASHSRERRIEKITSKCHFYDKQIKQAIKSLHRRAAAAANSLSLGFASSDAKFAGAPLSLVLVTNEFPQLPPTDDRVTSIYDPDFDFSLQISVDYLNAILEKFHHESEFDFCVNYSDTYKTCANGSEDLRVKVEEPPRIVWSTSHKTLVLEALNIRSRAMLLPGSRYLPAKMTDYPEIRVYFDITPGPHGIFFNPIIKGDMRLRHKNIFRSLVSAVKAMTLIHPLVAELMMGIKVEHNFEQIGRQELLIPTIPLASDINLPSFRVEKVLSTPQFIKFFLSL